MPCIFYMHLRRLEIFGFKTFATRTVIEFPAGITAIVGPNGSGKSNVTDAIRWVLGEQSFSALRCRRTEDLIFSGGAKRAPLGLAEVALTIDNSDRTLALPFDEVTLMRRSHRSGENEYFINKSKVRLRDIHEAVAPLGQSYTLVNQGMVDAALSLRPDERRSLFEDAAEISVSVSRRADAERRLRQTEDNLSRLYDVVAEIEPRLRTLKRQAREAEQVHDLEDQLNAALHTQFLFQWHAANRRVAQVQEELAQARIALADDHQTQTQLQQELAAAQHQLEQAIRTLEQHSQVATSLEQERATAAREQAVLSERLQAHQLRRTETAQRLQALQTDHMQADAEYVQLAERMVQTQQQVATAQHALAKLQADEQSLPDTRQQAQDATEQAREQAFQAANAVHTAQHDYTQTHNRVQAAAQEYETLQTEIVALHTQATTQQTAHAAALEALTVADQHIQTAQHQQQHLREEIDQARQQRQTIEAALLEARRASDATQSRLEALRRTVASGAGLFAGVQAALAWAETQQRSDFAVVSSIIEVPAALETALEVALGGRLQNIVVERWEDAEAAIAQLKRTNAGRATFLPLDTLRSSEPSAPPQEPGVIGVASTLINYQPRFERAVHYLLGRILVVEDLATARRVLRHGGNWSIVTVEGEQVSSAGAMSGGGTVRERGTLRRERELRELPQTLEQHQQQLAEHEQALHSWTTTITRLETTLLDNEQQRQRLRQKREQAQDQLAQLTRGLERLEQEREWHLGRSAALLQEHEQLEAALTEQAIILQAAQTHAAAMQHALEQARTAAEQAQQAAQASEERLLAARTTLAHAQATLNSDQHVLRTLTTQREQRAQQQRTLEQQASQFEADYATLQAQLEQAIQNAEHHQALSDQHGATLQPLLQKRSTATQHVQELEQRQRKWATTLLEAQATVGRAETSLAQALARREQIWERCAEEGIDIEALAQAFPAPAEPSPQLLEQIEQLRQRLKRMGTINPLAPQEYAELNERHQFMETQIADVEQAAQHLRELIVELEQAMNARFDQTFQAVAEAFQHTFTRLFGGGEAQLLLDEATQGIEIIAQPPGKRRQQLSLLSGGERSLTAVALLMALLQVNPTPFCVMDEVDAALDEANVIRFREMLQELSTQTQFIIVTHNRGTVEVAATLYGVTMQPDGASQVLSLRMDDFIQASTTDVTYVSTQL